MREAVKAQREELVVTLRRLQETIAKQRANGGRADVYEAEYAGEVAKYRAMRDGGDGGLFRKSQNTIRELHFAQWRDSDFQLLLEAIGEEPVMPSDLWDERFGHERTWFDKLLGRGGRPTC